MTRFYIWPNVGVHSLARVHFVALASVNLLVASNRISGTPLAQPSYAVRSLDSKIAYSLATLVEVISIFSKQNYCHHAHYAPTM